MKKLLLSLLLAINPLTSTLIPISAFAKTPFSTAQMAQHHIDKLTFKDIMRELYADKMQNTFVNDEDIEKMPHVGLGEVDGMQQLALMHPIVTYTGLDGQPRYLVIIERVQLNEDGSLFAGHALASPVDLYTFKSDITGGYQLVSRSIDGEQFGGSWGRTSLDTEQIKGHIKPLGRNLLGVIVSDGFGNMGSMEERWSALHLPEDDYIGLYQVGDKSGDNGGAVEENSPLAYSFDSTSEIVNNGGKYYPIRLTYTGDKPDDKHHNRIIKINGSKIVNFDPVKKTYH